MGRTKGRVSAPSAERVVLRPGAGHRRTVAKGDLITIAFAVRYPKLGRIGDSLMKASCGPIFGASQACKRSRIVPERHSGRDVPAPLTTRHHFGSVRHPRLLPGGYQSSIGTRCAASAGGPLSALSPVEIENLSDWPLSEDPKRTVHGPKCAACDTERGNALTCKCARWLWFGLVELGGIEPPTLRLPVSRRGKK